MKLKNILLSGLSLVLVAVIAIGGTVAYLTDTDSDVNVMTVGNVQVKLQEKQRSEDNSKLVDFVQGKALTPLVGSAQGAKDKWGQPSKDQASNYVDKIVYATNTGKNDAYIRFLVAIPTALIPDTTDSSNNPLHWSYGNRVDITGEGKYNTVAYADSEWKKLFGEYDDVKDADGNIASVTIDGEEYWVTYFPMAEALAPGADSLAVMAGLYLDNRVDYDADRGVYTFNGQDINYDFSEGVKVPVMVQAVQADGFKTAADAFTSAYGDVTVANAEEWFGGVEAPTVVTTADELKNALKDGKAVVLAKDITVTESISLSGGSVDIDGNGKTLTINMAGGTWLYTNNGSAINISDLTITGNVKYAVYNQGGNVTMDNVTVKGVDGNYVLCMYGGGNVVMNNCNVSGTAESASIWFGDGRTVTINGGTYSSMTINASKGAGVGSAGTLTLNNATVGKVRVGAYEDANGNVVRANLINNGSTINVIDYEK